MHPIAEGLAIASNTSRTTNSFSTTAVEWPPVVRSSSPARRATGSVSDSTSLREPGNIAIWPAPRWGTALAEPMFENISNGSRILPRK